MVTTYKSRSATTFNELLVTAGIDPKDVRLMRHQTRGKDARTPFTLWRDDRAGFERYQSTQRADRPDLRGARYWASFVSPERGETMFVGLYDVRRISSGPVEWPCPLRGGVVGEGQPFDLFESSLMDELSEHVGALRVAWNPANVRTWIRYAQRMNLPLIGKFTSTVSGFGKVRESGDPMHPDEIVAALLRRGFEIAHATSKVRLLRWGRLNLYVKRETRRLPLIIHPYYNAYLGEIRRISGIETDQPITFYVNSNLREFPEYTSEHRATTSRFGIDLSLTVEGLDPLLEVIANNLEFETPDGPTRMVGTSENPLTEREQLGLARVGQGAFRSALVNYWNGACAVTGIDQLELLRASHIKPWKAADNSERLDSFNGLLLAPHLDAAFDRGLITFGDDGRLIMSDRLGAKNAQELGLRPGLQLRKIDSRHRSYLGIHRTLFGYQES